MVGGIEQRDGPGRAAIVGEQRRAVRIGHEHVRDRDVLLVAGRGEAARPVAIEVEPQRGDGAVVAAITIRVAGDDGALDLERAKDFIEDAGPVWGELPPPKLALLPLMVLLATVMSVPKRLRMPPPKSALLPLMVLLVTASVPPSFKMPPPKSARLPLMVLLVTVSVPPSLKMPPPTSSLPPVITSPCRVALALGSLGFATMKTRELPWASIVMSACRRHRRRRRW